MDQRAKIQVKKILILSDMTTGSDSDSQTHAWTLSDQLHSLEQLLKWLKTKGVPLRPEKEHKQKVQHIIVMKKMKVEN